MAKTNICLIDGCGKSVFCRGWCGAHYHRWQRHGNPLDGRTKVGESKLFMEIAVKHMNDECLIWPFGRDRQGYARANGGDLVHQIICERIHGPRESNQNQTRHICGNGHFGCVAGSHLIWGTRKENMSDMIEHGRSVRGKKRTTQCLSKAMFEKYGRCCRLTPHQK
jgi:hypothetical protein